jgi:hypothetical protein
MVTIQVDPRNRAIIQARARCNMRPRVQSNGIIFRRAAWAGLQFDLRL